MLPNSWRKPSFRLHFYYRSYVLFEGIAPPSSSRSRAAPNSERKAGGFASRSFFVQSLLPTSWYCAFTKKAGHFVTGFTFLVTDKGFKPPTS